MADNPSSLPPDPRPASAQPSDPRTNPNVPNDPLTGHVYDGIQEFDNPLPGWWKWLFVGTIVFCFPYYAYYHFGGTGRTLAEQYDVALAENSRLMFAGMGDLGDDTASLVHAMDTPSMVSIGRSVFKANCVSCHGTEGGGLVGPNLTDDAYKNVRELTDIVRVVRDGAAAGAMPAWKSRLDPNEVILVSVYVAAMRGATPAGPAKGPEGQVLDPWPTPDQFPQPAADDGTEGEGATAGADEDAATDEENADAGDQRDGQGEPDAAQQADGQAAVGGDRSRAGPPVRQQVNS